jgi:hypothetical protein
MPFRFANLSELYRHDFMTRVLGPLPQPPRSTRQSNRLYNRGATYPKLRTMDELENWTRIPPRISQATAGVEYSHIRIGFGPVLDYVKTDRRYLVELEFPGKIEIALFARFLSSTSIRLSFYSPSGASNPRIFMSHPGVDDSSSSNDVWRWACEEMARIQSAIAMEFPYYSPGKVVSVAERLPNGSIRVSSGVHPVKVYGTSNIPTIDRLLNTTPATLAHHLKKCTDDLDYREAAMYVGHALGFAGANEWANLYRAFEVVKDRFGGDKEIIEHLSVCSKNDIERFTRTVNHQEAIGAFSRHARLNHQPPPNPIGFDEAVEFILALLKAWLESGQ